MGAASKVVKAEVALHVLKVVAATVGLAAAAKGLHAALGLNRKHKGKGPTS